MDDPRWALPLEGTALRLSPSYFDAAAKELDVAVAAAYKRLTGGAKESNRRKKS